MRRLRFVMSNPRIVCTGLELFDAFDGKYNFNTLVFNQTGYWLDVVRQAAGRSWRIGQQKDCEIHYLFYENTMQEKAARLMAEKTKAAQAVDGKFTDSGLTSLTGGVEDAAMVLAKSLSQKIYRRETVS